ncbi:MAG: hypothetical protein ABIH99_04535 [Candidatus Micrarchaeota archaeon]
MNGKSISLLVFSALLLLPFEMAIYQLADNASIYWNNSPWEWCETDNITYSSFETFLPILMIATELVVAWYFLKNCEARKEALLGVLFANLVSFLILFFLWNNQNPTLWAFFTIPSFLLAGLVLPKPEYAHILEWNPTPEKIVIIVVLLGLIMLASIVFQTLVVFLQNKEKLSLKQSFTLSVLTKLTSYALWVLIIGLAFHLMFRSGIFCRESWIYYSWW